MAVYKLFPYKDATLYSLTPDKNSGLDAISEAHNKLTNGSPDIARFLTQFDTTEIQDVIDNRIDGSQWGAFFRNYIADATGINLSTYLEIFPVAQNWENGTGTSLDSPETTDGVSWNYSDYYESTSWQTSGTYNTELFTSSYNPTYSTLGGGNWFYSGSGISDYRVTQSFDVRSDKDMNLNVTTIVDKWYSGSLPNYGFITKLTGSLEFYPSSSLQPNFKYYSVDTNTIYPPQLEFKWIDYTTVLTGSLSGNIVTTSNLKLSLNENPGVFYPDSINKFRVNVSPLYPPRTFQTSSYFTTKNFLPIQSYYAVKDLDTNEYAIDFDTQYTQISADSTSNYFTIYMNGLEPERYYKVLIKTVIDGNTKIFDENYYFKIVNE